MREVHAWHGDRRHPAPGAWSFSDAETLLTGRGAGNDPPPPGDAAPGGRGAGVRGGGGDGRVGLRDRDRECARDLASEEAGALGARLDRKGRPAPPSLSTFRRVLRRLGGQAVAAAFGAWLAAQAMAGLADASCLVIALYGKVVRGREGPAPTRGDDYRGAGRDRAEGRLSLIHISEPTRLGMISYAVF